MQKRTIGFRSITLVGLCVVLSLAADEKPPVFVFGGKQLYVGMSKHDAVAFLSACCKLSPPAETEVEKQPVTAGAGHFILSREGSPQRLLGGIFFFDGKVVRITRPMAEDVDTYSDDVVGFARAIKRTIAAETSDSGTSILVSVRHERMSNAESDVVFFVFPNGRGIEVHIGTLDKPNIDTNKRDFATLDETLEPPR